MVILAARCQCYLLRSEASGSKRTFCRRSNWTTLPSWITSSIDPYRIDPKAFLSSWRSAGGSGTESSGPALDPAGRVEKVVIDPI